MSDTLDDDSLDALSKAFDQDVLAGEFDAIPTLVERLMGALTADLAAAEQVIANVRALADEFNPPGKMGRRLRALLPAETRDIPPEVGQP